MVSANLKVTPAGTAVDQLAVLNRQLGARTFRLTPPARYDPLSPVANDRFADA